MFPTHNYVFPFQVFLQEMKEVAFRDPKIPPVPSALLSSSAGGDKQSSSAASPLRQELRPWPRGQWDERATRSGLIGRKIGVVPMWQNDGKKVMATMVNVRYFIYPVIFCAKTKVALFF